MGLTGIDSIECSVSKHVETGVFISQIIIHNNFEMAITTVMLWLPNYK